MKEVTDYIGRKFRYGSDIQWSLNKNTKTGVLSPIRQTRTRDGIELYRHNKFLWDKIITE